MMFTCTLEELIERSGDYVMVGQHLHDKEMDDIGQALGREHDEVIAQHGGHVVFSLGFWSVEFEDEPGSGIGGPTTLHWAIEMKDQEGKSVDEIEDILSKEFGYPIARNIIVTRSEPLPPKIDHMIDLIPEL